MIIILPNLNRFTKFLNRRFLGKLAVTCSKLVFKNPPLLAYVATITL